MYWLRDVVMLPPSSWLLAADSAKDNHVLLIEIKTFYNAQQMMGDEFLRMGFRYVYIYMVSMVSCQREAEYVGFNQRRELT